MQRLFGKVGEIKKKSVGFVGGSISFNGMENYFDSYNLKTYKESLYLFIGVSMIRDTVASIPLVLYKIKNKDGDVEEVSDDPVLDLIERPNSLQTKMEFWKLSVAYFLLAGETFWYLEKDGINRKQVPTSMVNMRPDNVEILLSENKRDVIGYEFRQSNGESITVPVDAVIHTKNIDPTNTLRGAGVVQPASQRIITEKEASKYQANTFKNQGRPDVAVFVDQDLTNEDAEQARSKWDEIYGSGKGNGAGFFGNNVKSMQVLNANPKEMDFINTQAFLRDDILAALHIPKAMVTSDDVNLANSQTARLNYIKEACIPVLETFLDTINNKMLNDIDNDKFLTYENPVNEDRELILKESVQLVEAGIITQNEARTIMNYPDMEGADELREVSGNMFQLSMKNKPLKKLARKHLKARPRLYEKFDAIEKVAHALYVAKSFDVAREKNPVFTGDEQKKMYIKKYNNNVDNKAVTFKTTLDVYNNQLLQMCLKQMEDFGANPQSIFNTAEAMNLAKDMFNPLMKEMYERVGQQTLDNVANGFSSKASEQFYTLDQTILQLEQRVEFFSKSMLDTDFKHLQEIIAAGLADGKGVAEIGRDMRQYFDDMSVARARTIARTETGRIVSQATREAYQQSELVTGMEWLTAKDGKVRDEHVMNDGVIVGVNESFPNGESFPGQLTINCRCALAPAV